MSGRRNGLLVNYEFCTGCHTCEIACKKVHGLDEGQWGIRVFQDGPRQIGPRKWELNFLPMPTSLCDLCDDRVATGKQPSCVKHCQAGIMQYGPVDELVAIIEDMPHAVLYTPEKRLVS